jgi:glycerol-3-phosphate cytidylyltransferase-like family protein
MTIGELEKLEESKNQSKRTVVILVVNSQNNNKKGKGTVKNGRKNTNKY